MRRNTALLLSGLLTAFAMVLVVGIISLAGRFSQAAQAAPAMPAGVTAADPMSTTDVPTLQAMAQAYKNALLKSNQDLQAAYDQIQTLNGQIQQLSAQNAQGGFGRRRFRGQDDGGGSLLPFGGNGD